MFSDFELFWGGCFLYFNACRKKWNITSKEMAEIVYKYRLVSLIEKLGDYLHSFDEQGVVEVLEQYIKRVDSKMEKDDIVNVPLSDNPPESEDIIQGRAKKYDVKMKIAESLGVNFLELDRDDSFLTEEEKEGYFRDCLLLYSLLGSEEPLPYDLIVRLVEVKDRREKVKEN